MPLRNECRLRPLAASDEILILTWRNSDRIRGNMYTDHIISCEEHAAWLGRMLQVDPPTFLIFELAGRPLGVVSATRIDTRNRTCHWGFYLGEADTPKGSGPALGFLGLEYIFGTLGMRKVIGEAFADNEGSIRFHQRLGFRQEGHLARHVLKGETYLDVKVFALFDDEWESLKEPLADRFFAEGIRHEKC